VKEGVEEVDARVVEQHNQYQIVMYTIETALHHHLNDHHRRYVPILHTHLQRAHRGEGRQSDTMMAVVSHQHHQKIIIIHLPYMVIPGVINNSSSINPPILVCLGTIHLIHQCMATIQCLLILQLITRLTLLFIPILVCK